MYKPGYNDRSFKRLGDSRSDQEEVKLTRQVLDYEKKFMDYLLGMHNALNKEQIIVDEVKSLSEILQHMKKEQTDNYYDALVRPESSKGSKIPSTIPVPSSSFQLHSQTLVTPNSNGNALIMFNPFYLATSSANPVPQTNSTFFVNNHSSLTGSGSPTAGTTTAVAVGQWIPSVYNAYRLVSASIVVKYIGDLMSVKGVIGGAIVFDSNVVPTAIGSANTNLDKYGDFNLAMDSYYYQENLTLNGIRELYFPLDNTYEQYLTPGTSKNGFAFVVYIQDGVASVPNYKVDIFCNYEALPDSAYLNYIPQSACMQMDQQRKEEAVRAVQQQPITNSEIATRSYKQPDLSVWDKIKSTLGNVLPSIGTLATAFLPGPGKLLGPLLQAGGQALNDNNKSWID